MPALLCLGVKAAACPPKGSKASLGLVLGTRWAGVLCLDPLSSRWVVPSEGTLCLRTVLFPAPGRRTAAVPDASKALALWLPARAPGPRSGAWSNRFGAIFSSSSLAARGSFRSGDAESPDPGPADPQPRHEGGDRRVHLGERLGGGLLRGRGGSAGPPGTTPPPPPRPRWHRRLSLGWHHALLALRLFYPLRSGCPETQRQRWARARRHLPFPRNRSGRAGVKAPPPPSPPAPCSPTALKRKTCPAVW